MQFLALEARRDGENSSRAGGTAASITAHLHVKGKRMRFTWNFYELARRRRRTLFAPAFLVCLPNVACDRKIRDGLNSPDVGNANSREIVELPIAL